MKLSIVCVGRPRGSIGAAIEDYERRIGRYFRFEVREVKETPGRGIPATQVIHDEGGRLLARVPVHDELVALHRPGFPLTSEGLATQLEEAALHSVPGLAFVIGGAYGLSDEVLGRAGRHVSLSSLTLPHELARLVLVEQLYRAGTIIRGEPYHKGPPGS